MRTTLDIDEDVLLATKEIARVGSTSIGKVISDLARRGLIGQGDTNVGHEARYRNGFRLFPPSETGEVVTLELVKRLLEDDE